MPPRKGKLQTRTSIDDTPVVFFLKIGDDQEEIAPAEKSLQYSEILNSVEKTSVPDRFNNDILKLVLEKVVSTSYTPQTVCFWCCHSFNWPASILPKSYDTYKNIYYGEGHFCSPECALAYNYADNKISDSTKWLQHTLLEYLYSDLYRNSILSCAPPRSLLRMFGGPLDIAQYREYVNFVNDIILSEIHPIRLLIPSINVQGPLRDIKKYVSLTKDVVEKASEQLRLKRKNPANINIQTLDMCIHNS